MRSVFVVLLLAGVSWGGQTSATASSCSSCASGCCTAPTYQLVPQTTYETREVTREIRVPVYETKTVTETVQVPVTTYAQVACESCETHTEAHHGRHRLFTGKLLRRLWRPFRRHAHGSESYAYESSW